MEQQFADYLAGVSTMSEIDRMSAERPKTGVFLQRYAINPVNGERCRCTHRTTSWPTTAPARSWQYPRA